ncbi:MAG TPA: cytochrome c [Polyangia bacterium]|jgi:mono/diheme cytochrome c family protein
MAAVRAAGVLAAEVFVGGLALLAGVLVTGCGGESGRPAEGGGTGSGGATVSPGSGGAASPMGMMGIGGAMVATPGPGAGGLPPLGGAPASACGTDATVPLAAGAAPPAYTSACSSCHGDSAGGKLYYPNLRANLTLDYVRSVVRAGKVSDKTTITTVEGKTIPARMPAFNLARVSEPELMAIYQYLSTPLDPNAQTPPYCLSRPEATWTDAQITEAYQRGLQAWRSAGTVDGNACGFCHGPDGMEFAALGFTDSQLYRRAFTHVDQATADSVIDMVHALRARFHLSAPSNPATTRVFQPGGEVLPGVDNNARDQAFGAYMKDALHLTLMGPPINNAADAHKAWQELVGINLRQLRVGIPFNHYTEDIFNNAGATPACPDRHQCDDHGTIADWISDVPVLTAATAAAVFAVQDTYLADPSLANVKAIVAACPRDDAMWFKNKFRSVQIANWLFRQQAGGMPMLDALPPAPFPVENSQLYNSIWMVGANLRDFIHNVGATLPTGGGKFSVPPETLKGLTRNDASEQLQRLIVPWFWLGFTFDPSTMNVQADYVAEGDEYFTQETFLDNGSYPIHGAFIVSKRSVEVMAYPALPRSPNVFPFQHPDLGRFPVTPLTMRAGYFPELTNFAEEKNFNTINPYQIKYMPADPTHKALYQTYTANMYRMFLWTLVDELTQTPSIWNPTILNGKIDKMEIFLTLPDVQAQNGAQDTALLVEARALVSKAAVNQ